MIRDRRIARENRLGHACHEDRANGHHLAPRCPVLSRGVLARRAERRRDGGQGVAVVVYAGLPMVLRNLLAIVSVLAGASADGFTLNNPVASNPGYFMNAADSPFWYFIASQLDVFLLWTLALTAIGFATTGKVKMGTSFAIVIGWWVVITLSFAAIFS